jgi:uncharacterized protein YndB with AHSA1/START domain
VKTRCHVHQEEFLHPPERVFGLLHTPSAIRGWWGAARAIVLSREGGTWAATWGDSEDEPEYVTVATIRTFDPPRRMVLSDYNYVAKTGPLPFKAAFVTEFAVEPWPGGCVLRVTQDGFPADPAADAFYAACGVGWTNTFAGIRRYLGG